MVNLLKKQSMILFNQTKKFRGINLQNALFIPFTMYDHLKSLFFEEKGLFCQFTQFGHSDTCAEQQFQDDNISQYPWNVRGIDMIRFLEKLSHNVFWNGAGKLFRYMNSHP